MGKALTYISIMSVVILGFHFAGLIVNTPAQWFLNALLDLQNFSTNPLYTNLVNIFTIFGGATIVIGTFIGDKVEQGATVAYTLLLITLGWEIVGIFSILRETNVMLATLLISPFLLMYILVVKEWWGGRD